jgi:hypothetical protein
MRTVVNIPEPLWRAAKIRAMDEHTSLTGIVTAALAAYLDIKAPKAKKGGGR